MLYQIIVSGLFFTRGICEFTNGIQLVIARKYHCLFCNRCSPARPIVDCFFLCLQKNKASHYFNKTVALQNLFPEISRSMARRMLWISFSALDFSRMAPAIKGQEERLASIQLCAHVNFVRVCGEENHSPFLKLKKRRARVTVSLKLPNRVSPRLPGHGVL